MPLIKKSYGIICCRHAKKGLEILMIKKATTYHFCEFIAGHYKRDGDDHLRKLFNNMTYHEKMDILGLQFSNMWYRIYRENPEKITIQNHWLSSYLKKKAKFETNFIRDSGARLKSLISNSVNVDTPWEFPKGRADEKESDIEAAIREFNEETGISDTQYKLLLHLKPYVETYTDFKTTYKNTYYYAVAATDLEPEYKFSSKNQTSEISSMRWISRMDLQHLKLEDLTYKRLMNSFDKIIKKYKNSFKVIFKNNIHG